MRCRDPQRIIELYNWLWRRAVNRLHSPFASLKPSTLTGRAIVLLIPRMIRIDEAMKSRAYKEAVSIIIHSN